MHLIEAVLWVVLEGGRPILKATFFHFHLQVRKLFKLQREQLCSLPSNFKPNNSDYYTMNISQSTVINTVSQWLILSKQAADNTQRRKPHIKGHLFPVPCESGNYWKCDVSSCVACPQTLGEIFQIIIL